MSSRESNVSSLKRLWNDLRQGQHVEIIATLAVAVIVAFFSIFNVVDSRIISAATLATLALMSSGMLGTRHQGADGIARIAHIEHLLAESSRKLVLADRYLNFGDVNFHRELEGARDIRLVGLSRDIFVRSHFSRLENLLRAGARLQVVLIEPSGVVAKDAVRRHQASPDAYGHRIRLTLDQLRKLSALCVSKDSLEIRLIDYMPAYGLTMFDASEERGRIYVHVMSYGSIPDPTFILRADVDKKWFEFYLRQFDILWQDARKAMASDGYQDQ